MNNYYITTILKNIHNKKINTTITKYNEKTNKTNNNKDGCNINIKQLHYDNIHDAQFVNENAYSDTLKYLKDYKIFNIIINDFTIKLYIFHQKDYNYKQLVYKIYKYVKLFYKTFEKFIQKSGESLLHLYIYTLPYKNIFHKPILGTNHINSGYTQYKPIDKKKIVIYKTHKLIKVLIHELIHFFNIDITILPQNVYSQLDNFIQKNIKTNYQILTFEGITEFFAIYLHTIYKHKTLNINKIKDKLNEQIAIYTKYMNIILKNQNIRDINDIISGKVVFKQQTNVFSYYILATLLFKNYEILFKSNNIIYKDINKIVFN